MLPNRNTARVTARWPNLPTTARDDVALAPAPPRFPRDEGASLTCAPSGLPPGRFPRDEGASLTCAPSASSHPVVFPGTWGVPNFDRSLGSDPEPGDGGAQSAGQPGEFVGDRRRGAEGIGGLPSGVGH